MIKQSVILRVLAVLLACSMAVGDSSFAFAMETETSAEQEGQSAGVETLVEAGDGETDLMEEVDVPAETESSPLEESSGEQESQESAQDQEGPIETETAEEQPSVDAETPDTGAEAPAEEGASDTEGTEIPSDEANPDQVVTGEASESPVQEETAVEETPVESPYATEEEAAAMAVLEAELEEAMGRTYTDYSYSSELAKFPASYQTYLKRLHNEHPNWIFVAVDTGLDWADVIDGELGANSTIDYNLNGATHTLLLNNHTGYYGGYSLNGYKQIDGQHVSCSRAAIGYYMDPRNFLTYKYPFQFEDLTFNANIQTISGVEAILKAANSTSNGLYHQSLARYNSTYGDTYAEVIYNVGRTLGISPYYLASKIVQETGATITNDSISGNRSGYTGLYNFYNIGAYPHDGRGAVENGLIYARNHGWTNPILAIYGGAEYIGKSYIMQGQNTGYYQKFNVSPDSAYSTYTHQYMSSIYSAASEATKTYDAYDKVDALDSGFLFFIPLYSNMPAQSSIVSLTPATTGTLTEQRRIYSEPSTASSSLVTASSGTSVQVLGGRVTSTETYLSRLYYPYWYQVKVTVSGVSYTGYVQEQFVSLRSAYTLRPGSTKSVQTVLSVSGTAGTLYYETSNPKVATVSDGGIITAVANGSCKIYAISTGGSFDAIGLTVSSTGSVESAEITLDTPRLAKIANGNGYVSLQWKKVADATGYAVWRKEGSAAKWTKIGTVSSGSTFSYRDSSVKSGVTYCYTVRAIAKSNGRTVSSSYDKNGLTICYLAAPKLGTISATQYGVAVTWQSVSGATSYLVYRSTSGSGWQRIATLPSGTTGYVDGKAAKGVKYRYTVRVTNGSGSYSAYYTTGLSATAATTQAIVNLTAQGAVSYRQTASASAKVAGSYAKGSVVQVIPKRVVSASGKSWYPILVNGTETRYVDGTNLLLTPVLKGIAHGNGFLRVSWYQTPEADSYAVYRKTASSQWMRVATLAASASSFDDKTLSASGTYIYTVRAVTGKQISGYDTTGVRSVYLTAPVLTGISNQASGISLTWKSDAAATSYAVYRRGGSDSGWKMIGTTTKPSYVDQTAVSGTTYRYTVRSVAGGVRSGYDTQGLSYTRLSNPALSAVSCQTSGLRLSWKAVSGAASFRVYRKSGNSGWKMIATTSRHYYNDATAAQGQTYTYTVRAVRGTSLSDYQRAGISGVFLAAPKLASAVNIGSAISVSWGKVTGASGYAIYRKQSGASAWSKLATLSSGSITSYVDASVRNGTAYTYTVRATKGRYLSGYERDGVSATASASVSLSKAVTISACSFYSSMSTSKAAGKIRQQATVNIVANWSATSGGTTWYRLKNSKGFYYVPAKSLLCTPALRSVSSTADGLQVRWARDSASSGYTVWRATAGSRWTKIATISSNRTVSYIDQSAVSGVEYTYTVRSYRGNIQSKYDTKGITCVFLATPELYSAGAEGQGIALSWSEVPGADGYRIYRKNGNSGWKQIAASDATSYLDQSSLTPGVQYVYTVRAYKGTHLSAYDTGGISALAQ